MQTTKLTGIPSSDTYTWQIGTEQNPISGGLNLIDLEYQLANNQSPKMVNMWYNNRVLGKRWGQEWACEPVAAEIGTSVTYEGEAIAAAGTALYRFTDGVATTIYTGLTSDKGTFFTFNGRLYFINGHEYLVYDGNTVTAVEPYKPNIIINRPPDGLGGDLTDNYNRLGAGFRNTFTGDGTTRTYVLTDKGLDNTPITAIVNGVATTAFTADYAAGTVTFNTAPPIGTNNVEITAYKTEAGMRENLLSCTLACSFGGENETRIFLAGNGTSTYYYSDVTMPDYFPENNYNVVGDNTDPITGLARQYGVMVVFTANELWQVSYNITDTRVSFPIKAINRGVGCDCPKTIQLIDNNLVWLHSKKGVCILLSTYVQDERNVQVISRNINGNEARPGLLQEANLKNACSTDYQGKYWLCVNSHVYLWDYAVTPYVLSTNPDLTAKGLAWFYFEGVSISRFLQLDRLYGVNGARLVRFVEEYRDFGTAFKSVWRMPIRDFNLLNQFKSVIEMWVTARTDTNTKINIRYVTEQNQTGEEEPEPIVASSYSWGAFNWDTFTWRVMAFAKTFRRKPKKKKIEYFALEFYNDEPGRDMNISGVTLTWRSTKKIK